MVFPLPFGPTSATRSPTRRSRSTGPSRNEPRSTTAPRAVATTSPLRPVVGIVNRSSQASRGSSTASRRSTAFWVRAALPASCSVWLTLKWRMCLSFSPDFLTFACPWLAHSRSRCARCCERRPLGVVLVESFAGVLSGQFPLGEERLPSAGEPGRTVRVVVDLDHVGDRTTKERSIVAHQQHRGVEAENPPLQSVESVEIEVVRRLVEQEHVESRQQQRRQRRPGRLPSRERDRRLVEQSFRRGRGRSRPRRRERRSRRRRAPATGRVRPSTGRRRRVRRRRARRSQRRVPPARRPRRCAEPGTREPSRWSIARVPAGADRRWRFGARSRPSPDRARPGRRARRAASTFRRRSGPTRPTR